MLFSVVIVEAIYYTLIQVQQKLMAQFSDNPAACVGGEQGLKESLISFCSATSVCYHGKGIATY